MQLERVLTSACRAPSLHNSQPWKFAVTADRIDVHLDPERLVRVSDADGREARISCGAAIFNLRLGLARYGIQARVSLLPDGPNGPVAVITRVGSTVISPELAELERAIAHRRTNRRPFSTNEVSRTDMSIMARAVAAEGAVLHYVTDPAGLREIRAGAATAHRIQLADPSWVAEWTAWTGRTDGDDGVPASAAGPAREPQDFFTLRDFGLAGRPPRPAGKDFEDHPLIAVLSTHVDTPVHQLKAGEALERLLLAATVSGISASFLSQLIEVPSAAKRVRALTGNVDHPQAVLRLGFGVPTPATPRRSVEACLLSSPEDYAALMGGTRVRA